MKIKIIPFITLISLITNSIVANSMINENDEENCFYLFQHFIFKYNKKYTTIQEFQKRWLIFRDNLHRPKRSEGRWLEGITKFFDLTPEEFKIIYLKSTLPSTKSIQNIKKINITNLKTKSKKNKNFSSTYSDMNKTESIIFYFNWVDFGYVPDIKDQGTCGANFAFTTCGNIEIKYAMKHGEFLTCSEQNIIDCDNEEMGCLGGDEVSTSLWLKRNGGVMTEEEYPYIEEEGMCYQNKSKFGIVPNDIYEMVGHDEGDMRDFLIIEGPPMVLLNGELLQFYMAGIIDPDYEDCDPEVIDFSGVLVGFGIIDEKRYWIVRNSFGENWGEGGYFRIARGKNACGINTRTFTMGVE